MRLNTTPKIAIINSSISGVMGERVLWQYLCENIDEAIGLDMKTMGATDTTQFAYKCSDFLSENTSITCTLENATFHSITKGSHFKIVYLQDNLRKLLKNGINYDNKLIEQQKNNLQSADMVVTNSIEIIEDYKEFSISTLIPIGVDSVLFKPKTNLFKVKYSIPLLTKVGIFVGEMSDVKGWQEMLEIVTQNPNIFFIIVSKNTNDSINLKNVKVFNCIRQKMLCELLNCADFFIMTSKNETQCLAAIEAGMCDIPIIMYETGFTKLINKTERNMLGEFSTNMKPDGHDLGVLIDKVLGGGVNYSPRKILLKNYFDQTSSIKNFSRLFKVADALRAKNNYEN